MSVERLLHLLRAPDGGSLTLSGDRLESSAGGVWPVVDGAPNFLEMAVEGRSDHLSHALPQKALDLISSTEGLVLNLSAGGTLNKAGNVIELEWGLYGNTDVSADAHDLPFRDGIFDGVICLNSFEHYRDPLKVASEIRRVLKPEGYVYVITAFLQPYHMAPHHYYNVTPNGLRNWFDGWKIEQCGATEFHNVILALQWIANSALWALELDGPKPLAAGITLEDLRHAWQGNWPENVKAAHALAAKLPQQLRDDAAQALEIYARKPADGETVDRVSSPLQTVIRSEPEVEEPVSGDIPDIRKTVMICFDSRTGSHLLCSYLTKTGLFGSPGEYFNRDGRDDSYPRHPRSQLKVAKQLSTSADGVFSFNLDPGHFERVAPYFDLAKDLPNPYFINLRRNDLLGQAISLVRARQTGRWLASAPGFSNKAEYDAKAISTAMRELSIRRERWELFYARYGIVPLRLTFEEVVADPIAAVRKVCSHCAIDWTATALPPPVSLKQQSDDLTAQWRERFIGEMRDVSVLEGFS